MPKVLPMTRAHSLPCRRSCGRWLALLLVPFAAVARPPAKDTGLDACPTALELVFTGLGDTPAVPLDVPVCMGKGDAAAKREFAFDRSDAPRGQVIASALLTRKGDAYALVLSVGPEQRSARGLAMAAAAAVLTREGAGTGAPVRVQLKPLSEPYIGLDLTHANPRELAINLAKLKHIEIAGTDRIAEAPLSSFYLPAVPLRSVLQVIAGGAGLELRPKGDNGFEFGAPRNAAAIEAERTRITALRESGDKAALRASLLKIIALGSDTTAAGWEPFLAGDLDELAALAEEDENWSDAEKYRKLQLRQIESRPDLSRTFLPVTLAYLAGLRQRQGDKAGAADFDRRARAAANTLADSHVAVQAMTVAILGSGELAAGDLAAAATDSERACALIASTGNADMDALWRVARLAGDLGNHYADAKQFDAAHVHMERNFALHQRIFGVDAPEIDVYRTALMFNAVHRRNRALAATYQEQQIAVSERRSDPVSSDYVIALVYFTPYLVQQRRLDDATRRWRQVVDLRERYFGKNHEQVVLGLRQLALLHRLNARDADALTLRKRADAITPVADASGEDDARVRLALEFDLGLQLRAMYEAALLQRDPATAPDLAYAELVERRGIVALEVEEDAVPYLREALDLRERLQGKEHADTQRTRTLLQTASL
jgi:hypothetical protein